MMINQQDLYIAEIQKKYPDLIGPEASCSTDGGQYNDILIFGNALVFRFPKYYESIETIVKEIEILQKICGQLPLPVPDPRYSSIDEKSIGRVFMGYSMISGEPLWRDVLSAIDDATVLDRFAFQLAGFLVELHKIPYQELGLHYGVIDALDEWIELYSEIQTNLYEFMRPDARQRVTQHFEGFIHNRDLHSFTPALRHGDFGSSNILFDPDSLEISGILDFGFAGIGDPAIDLAAVSTFGDPFFQKILKYYSTSENIRQRAAFYRGTFALQESLYGLKNDDKDAFNAGMEGYLK